MYKELDKFKTGKIIDGIVVLPDKQEVKIKLDEYAVNLGDLVEDFIKHQTKPRWKRKFYHEHLTNLYKEILNQIEIRINNLNN
jgi:hypothetical protein